MAEYARPVQYVEEGEGGRAAEGQPRPGAAGGHVVEPAERSLRAEHGPDWRDAAAESLAQAYDVRGDAEPFDRQEGAAPAAAGLNLVGAQQPAMLGAQLVERGEE